MTTEGHQDESGRSKNDTENMRVMPVEPAHFSGSFRYHQTPSLPPLNLSLTELLYRHVNDEGIHGWLKFSSKRVVDETT